MIIALTAVALFVIANTIRIAVYARRQEIEIMKLVGATDWFVRGPFLIEGAFIGLVGATIAAIALVVLYLQAAPTVTRIISFLPIATDVSFVRNLAVFIVLRRSPETSSLVGSIGQPSYVSVRRSGGTSPYRSAPLIVVQGVTKRYDGEPALADVSIAVARGEFAFLIGSNGAGKTTLLRILLREEAFDSGVVLVNGVDVSRIRGAALTKFRRRIGVVFQDTRLLPNATVRENVGLPLQVRGRANREIDRRGRRGAAIACSSCGYKSERFPRQLSGGEQRKVALARAVIAKPDILLCDEPTDSINPTHAREIMGLLLEINSDGVTTLVATHDSEIVNNLRRRVIRMDAGAILADEPVGVFNSG